MMYEEYYPNGLIKLSAEMQAEALHGLLKLYEENGELLMKARYVKGELHGRLCIYALNQINQVMRYASGKKHGHAYSFSNTRQVISKENFVEDKLHGKALYYYKNGNIAKESQYHHGLRHGEEKWYDPEGKLQATYFYEQDKLIYPTLAKENTTYARRS